MEYTENLHLNLPGDDDPLLVSKLSENFRVLDEAVSGGGGGDAGAIASGLEIGDIVYSTRNLEELTGGELIACDQRTIDLDAYPDIPRDALFWPYAELVFTDTAQTNQITVASKIENHQPPGANTDEWIYLLAVTLNSSTYTKTVAYSLKEKKVYTSNENRFVAVIRLSEDRLLLRPDSSSVAVRFAKNDLTNSDVAMPTNYSSALNSSNGAIARIDDTRFFLLVFQDVGSTIPHGFYTTSDGFLTLQSISMPATNASDISYARFVLGKSELQAYTMIESPFYPMRRMRSGEMLVVFGSSTLTINLNDSDEQVNRTNLKKIIPTVWRTSGNYANIAVGAIGGDMLFDWILAEAHAVLPEGAGGYTYDPIIQIASDCTLPVDGKFLFRVDFGRYRNAVAGSGGSSGSEGYTDSRFVLVDLETDEFKVSERYDYKDINGKIRFNTLKSLLYCKDENELYYFYSKDTVYVINLSDLTFTTVSPILDGLGTPQAYANYMPSAVTVVFDNKYDKRMWERGIEAINKNALCILNRDMTAMNFSSPLRPVSISTGGSSERQISPSVSAPGNLTEYDGDLYLGQGASLYKIPLKTKRQMPYIEHGYMKVLDDKEGA